MSCADLFEIGPHRKRRLRRRITHPPTGAYPTHPPGAYRDLEATLHYQKGPWACRVTIDSPCHALVVPSGFYKITSLRLDVPLRRSFLLDYSSRAPMAYTGWQGGGPWGAGALVSARRHLGRFAGLRMSHDPTEGRGLASSIDDRMTA